MKSIALGQATVYHYGLLVAAAAAISLIWMALAGRNRLKRGAVSVFALFALPLSFLGARLLLCLVSQGWYLFRQDYFFNFARGGYMLYGAMAGAALAVFVTALLTGEKPARIADCAAAPGALMIALCRLGEGYMGSGFGRNIIEWFDPFMEQSMIAWEDPTPLCRFPFGIPDYYGEWHFSIFLLEALAAVLIAVKVSRRKLLPGGRTATLLLFYASWQALFESMRADSVLRWGFVRVNQLLSAVVVAGVLLVCCLIARERFSRPRVVFSWIGLLCCMGIVMAMEFAIEQKIQFLRWMRMDQCYLVMIVACRGMITFVKPALKAAFAPRQQ